MSLSVRASAVSGPAPAPLSARAAGIIASAAESSRDGGAAGSTRRGVAGRVDARTPARPPPELHVLGEIVGGAGFGSAAVCCKWSLAAGERWEVLEGATAAQTHTCAPDTGEDLAVWAHPLDVHYSVGTMHGWPHILVQVCAQDVFGRLEVLGYGSAAVPASTGTHEVSIHTWTPVSDTHSPAGGVRAVSSDMCAFFTQERPVLKSRAVLYAAATERFRLCTRGSGVVHVRFDVIARHMDAYGVDG